MAKTRSETYLTKSAEETHALAAELFRSLQPGDVLALHGELGAGKTCFVQGLAAAMKIAQPIGSPTFTLINEYKGTPCPLYHVDLYRVKSEREAETLGLDEYFERGGIVVIEWAERAASLLPDHTLHLKFEPGAQPNERRITLTRKQ